MSVPSAQRLGVRVLAGRAAVGGLAALPRVCRPDRSGAGGWRASARLQQPSGGRAPAVTRHNIELGRFGELLAETHLVKLGARVLARNYRSAPGEIDLVVEHEGDLVAVEVKTRTDLELEAPEEAVTRWKLRRMAHGLESFAAEHDLLDRHWRLDVVAVELDLDGVVRRCEHIRDAYQG